MNLVTSKIWKGRKGNSEICLLTVGDSEQSMFGTVCDGTDGVLMGVMGVMGVCLVNAFLGALFATVCQHQLLTSGT